MRILRPIVETATNLVPIRGAQVRQASLSVEEVRASIGAVVLLCLLTAIASGLAKLAVDATIQERVPEQVRASAFAHAETLLMLSWVAGAAVGLAPFGVRWGLGLAALGTAAAAVRAVVAGWRLRVDRLTGRSDGPAVKTTDGHPAPADTADPPRRTGRPAPAQATPETAATTVLDEDGPPPGFTIYRPSSRDSGVADPRSGM